MADKVKMQLAGLDGNAFALMGAFSRNARRRRDGLAMKLIPF